MCVGELSTNNIYGRPGECHSHFHDLMEAYQEAGGNVEEFHGFMKLAEQTNLIQAIEQSPELWSKASFDFVTKMLSLLQNPLTCFLIMLCNETLTGEVYPPAIQNLCKEPRFGKFRWFMKIHIELDGEDHGFAALDWLKIYVDKNQIPQSQVETAIDQVMELYTKQESR